MTSPGLASCQVPMRRSFANCSGATVKSRKHSLYSSSSSLLRRLRAMTSESLSVNRSGVIPKMQPIETPRTVPTVLENLAIGSANCRAVSDGD
eukprot:scaffold248_cov265-Pinguiococcus_pyrenoidosus.AAC.3